MLVLGGVLVLAPCLRPTMLTGDRYLGCKVTDLRANQVGS